MFIKKQGWKKILKEAYQGSGIKMENTGDYLYISGSYWAVEIVAGTMPKEKLAAVIELAGRTPYGGEKMWVTKEGEVQWENEPNGSIAEAIQKAEENKTPMKVTRIVLKSNGYVDVRVLQDVKTDAITLIGEWILEMIDGAEAEKDGYGRPEGPMKDTSSGAVYWTNGDCTLLVMPVLLHGDNNDRIIQFLQGFEIEP